MEKLSSPSIVDHILQIANDPKKSHKMPQEFVSKAAKKKHSQVAKTNKAPKPYSPFIPPSIAMSDRLISLELFTGCNVLRSLMHFQRLEAVM